jgi:hypothetical protein
MIEYAATVIAGAIFVFVVCRCIYIWSMKL